jgi:predicted RNA methylase
MMDIEEMKREKQMGPMNVMFLPPYGLSVSQMGGYFHSFFFRMAFVFSSSHRSPSRDHQRKRAMGGTQMVRMTMSSVMITLLVNLRYHFLDKFFRLCV